MTASPVPNVESDSIVRQQASHDRCNGNFTGLPSTFSADSEALFPRSVSSSEDATSASADLEDFKALSVTVPTELVVSETNFLTFSDILFFPIIDVRRVPGDIAGIGFGMRFEKGVELFFTFGLKFLYILRDHEGHVSPAKVSNPEGLGP